jgi:hypothetical protein
LPTAEIEAFKAEIKQLKTLVNNQQKSQEKTSMSHIIAIAASNLKLNKTPIQTTSVIAGTQPDGTKFLTA